MTGPPRFARTQAHHRRATQHPATRNTPLLRPAPRLPRLALPAATVLVAILATGCAGKFMDRGPNPAFCDTSKVYAGIDAGVGAAALFWGLQVDMDRMTNHFTFNRLEDGSLGGAYEAIQLAAGVIAGASFLVEAGRSFKAANRCVRIKSLQDSQRRDAERGDTLRARTDTATTPDRAALAHAEMRAVRDKLRSR